MSNMRNSVKLIGRLGHDPEIREFQKGKNMAKFSMATSENYKNAQGEWVNETQWHRIVAWGRLADMARERLFKGCEVAIEGKLVTNSFETKEGVKRYSTEINLRECLVLDKKKEVETA
jgi:single-strand DNA-binding protein